MKRILLPLDGSEFGERALIPGLGLAKRFGAELHLATVVSDLPPIPLASDDGELVSRWFDEERDRAAAYLGQVVARLSEADPGVRIEMHVRVGAVTRTLEAIGREIGAEIILLTTHGRGTWQRAWLGSVADQLLRHGNFPLLLLPGGIEEGRTAFEDPAFPSRVLVPLDGSPAAESVLTLLPSILPAAETEVTLAAVVHRPHPITTVYLPHAISADSLMEEHRREMGAYLAQAEGRVLKGGGIPSVQTRLLESEDVAAGILELSMQERYDLIALSTHGKGGVSRLLLGSVADKVLRGAHLPLLIARRTGE